RYGLREAAVDQQRTAFLQQVDQPVKAGVGDIGQPGSVQLLQTGLRQHVRTPLCREVRTWRGAFHYPLIITKAPRRVGEKLIKTANLPQTADTVYHCPQRSSDSCPKW